MQTLLSRLDPEQLKHIFFLGQFSVGAAIVFLLWRMNRSQSKSGFKVTEAELQKNKKSTEGLGQKKGPDLLASATIKKKPESLRLSGIRIDGSPHEILGVSPQASESEIQTAYRELMKQYHPDKVGRPGTREWTDAQRIAEAINTARTTLLSVRPSNRPANEPNRPGKK